MEFYNLVPTALNTNSLRDWSLSEKYIWPSTVTKRMHIPFDRPRILFPMAIAAKGLLIAPYRAAIIAVVKKKDTTVLVMIYIFPAHSALHRMWRPN